MDKPRNRIKEVLEEKGIKQTWLAEKLGKSVCIVNSYDTQLFDDVQVKFRNKVIEL